MEKKVSIKQLLFETDLKFLEDEFIKEGVDLEELFTEKNSKHIIEIIYNCKAKINKVFQDTRPAVPAHRYFFQGADAGCGKY